ncbi:hypothetical protein KSP39_PZI016893 [Platanthera zijinensis]|uniref:Uncharacterized protein n=1 Tax=Platanthera zijinensis TaxID=2320716 RepID=A0AAP0B7Y5_9ASPA
MNITHHTPGTRDCEHDTFGSACVGHRGIKVPLNRSFLQSYRSLLFYPPIPVQLFQAGNYPRFSSISGGISSKPFTSSSLTALSSQRHLSPPSPKQTEPKDNITVTALVTSPLAETVETAYPRLTAQTAVIEMLKELDQNPLIDQTNCSSYPQLGGRDQVAETAT